MIYTFYKPVSFSSISRAQLSPLKLNILTSLIYICNIRYMWIYFKAAFFIYHLKIRRDFYQKICVNEKLASKYLQCTHRQPVLVA
ncbi:hypothetical protein BpHYR1_024621 [Brachionus plicatilis]|uniref:Uncharacterized protein n=1 Tax=Brachionus plicatilis TaxID=10195 RepID=A0A3M7SR32_BRAPC|nr:hypothetical protein BpHYR1_024621 [Brachionus plicatilis]